MSTHRSNVRVSLCSFTFADGRHCRTPREDRGVLGNDYLAGNEFSMELLTN